MDDLYYPAVYAELLQMFMEPLEYQFETEAQFMTRCHLGMAVWNYYICKKHNMKILPAYERAMKGKWATNQLVTGTIEKLMAYKKRHFDQFEHFILNVEKKITDDGSLTLHVDSVPWEKVDKSDAASTYLEKFFATP